MNIVKNHIPMTRGDLTIHIQKILGGEPCHCGIYKCESKDLYNIQFEKLPNLGDVGGTFCAKHIKDIFNLNVEE